MKQLTYDLVKSVYEKHTYPFPVSNDKVLLKITGIRTNNQIAGGFDDYFAFCWEESGTPQLFACMGTTHPGAYYMEHPMNPAGSAVVVPGYHADVWKRGFHKQNPLNRALVQVKDILIWRDNDGGNLLPRMECTNGIWQAWDANNKLLQAEKSGLVGIQLHGTKPDWSHGLNVGKWSAGCQVIERWTSKEKVMDLAQRHAADNDSDVFSYALTVEDDYA
jgi:hypothetical protein